MKKRLVQIPLFFLIFCLLFAGLSRLMIPKDSSQAAGIHNPLAKGFLAEPENSLDVLIIGDSEAYAVAIPLEIWANTGICVYSIGTPDQKLYETESYLDRFLQTQSPKLVFLETNIFYRNYSTLDVIPHLAEETFPLLRYHDRWKNLTVADITQPVHFRSTHPDRGYKFESRILPADVTGYMEYSEEIAPISRRNQTHLKSILARCREAGAELILFSAPSPVNWSWPRHNQVAILAEELGLEYLDLNLRLDEIPINWQTDTLDAGDHMNYWGAMKISAWFGDYLESTGLFEDKRALPEYAAWNRDLDAFRTEMAAYPQP